MQILLSHLQDGVSYIVPMAILLGLLIFIHEMGHFLVAKHFGVRVETFSLGFGPKLFKFKRGETTYAISAIPLGGYVKMFGDEPGGEIQADQRGYAFTHKPVGQRIAIVLAGPLMNFAFAIAVFMAVAMIGEQAVAPKLGDIAADTPAYSAGLRSGDSIEKIDGKPMATWESVQRAVEGAGDKQIKFDVKRDGHAGSAVSVVATPKTIPNKNVLSWDDKVGDIEGLSAASRAAALGVADPKSLAGVAGFRTGDLVTAVNGVKVDKWREFEREMKSRSADEKVSLTIARDESALHEGAASSASASVEISKTIELPLRASDRGASGAAVLSAVGIEYPEMFLAPAPAERSFWASLGIRKAEKSPAAAAGLRAGDKIVSVSGKPAKSFDEVAKMIRSYSGDAPLKIGYVRDGNEISAEVVPNMRARMSQQGREEKRFEIGIRPFIIDAPPAMTEISFPNPIAAFGRGVSQTVKWTSLTVLSFVRLFQAEVSAKNIGGFLSIGQMAKRSWQMGASHFLNIMGIISINLFILNLLPVPVLDGGHLAFYSIEAIRGAPLSMKKLEMAQQVGLMLLLGLMAFALFNDVSRIFGG